MILPFLGYSQVQYTIADVPVCWSVNGTDSSIVKFTIVTTQGAFLDLGYFDPAGNPVTVSGGTVKTGFCVPSDSISIDSTGRTFTLNIGDQSVSWNGGAEYYAQLLDVDTAGVDTNYIAKYSPSAGGWKMYDNNLDGLTDAVVDPLQNNLIIGDTTNIPFLPGADNNGNVGLGVLLFRGFNLGSENLIAGIAPLYLADSSSRVVAFGKNTAGSLATAQSLAVKNKHNNSVFLGQFAGGLDTFSYNSVLIGNEVNLNFPYGLDTNTSRIVNSVLVGGFSKAGSKNSLDEIVIGANVTGKGDSTATLGLPFYKGTYLNGNLNLNGYGAGNKLPGLIAKTGSPYLALLATDGTITEIHRDSVGGGGGSGIDTILANNGVRNAGTVADPVIRLGGILLENTVINGSNSYLLSAQNLSEFIIGTTGSFPSYRIGSNTNYISQNDISGFQVIGTKSWLKTPETLIGAVADSSVAFYEGAIIAPRYGKGDFYVSGYLDSIDYVAGFTNAAGNVIEIPLDSIISRASGGGGFTLPTDSITFNDNSLDAVAGKLQRDDNVGTLVYGSPTGVPLRTAGTLGWYVKNQTGSQIDKGTVVRAAGTVGNSDQILIDKMIADGSIEAKFTLGITAENIANGADGWVFDHGKIKPLDLSAYNSGAVLYVSATVPGGLTDTVPVAPDLVLPIGFVVDSTSNGTLAVRTGIQTTVSASNGLTATATADNTETKLGGDLTQFTEIDGSNTYGIRFDSLGSFSAFAKGDVRLRADSTTFGVNSTVTLDDFSGVTISSYGSANNYLSQLIMSRTAETKLEQNRPNFGGLNVTNGFTIRPQDASARMYSFYPDSIGYISYLNISPTQVNLRTPAISDTIPNGWVLTLVDSATAKIEYTPLNSIEQDTAAAMDFENLPNKIYQFDFTGKSSATVSFTNVKTAAVYVIHVLNSNAGDVITWPADCKTETGATLTSTTLAGAGRIFTMYFDGTNYYIK